jgi:tetratricopeptide (TPR) repeat protein
MGDLFALQNESTGRIATTLNLELVGVEAARPTDNPDALDYILRGRAKFLRSWTPEAYPEAIGLFERALALDPASTEAKSSLADALTGRVMNNMTNSRAADLARAEGLVGQALAASPRSPLAHYAKAQFLRAQDRCGEAIPEYETVIALNRNSAGAYASLGSCKYFTGSIDETIPLQERAIRLSPHDTALGVWYWRIGVVPLLQSRIDEAIPWLEKGRGAIPAHPLHHAWLAAAYALKGESEQAAAELAEARKLSGDDRYSSIARMKAGGYFGVPKIRALFEATYFAGLRKAGMPEE